MMKSLTDVFETTIASNYFIVCTYLSKLAQANVTDRWREEFVFWLFDKQSDKDSSVA